MTSLWFRESTILLFLWVSMNMDTAMCICSVLSIFNYICQKKTRLYQSVMSDMTLTCIRFANSSLVPSPQLWLLTDFVPAVSSTGAKSAVPHLSPGSLSATWRTIFLDIVQFLFAIPCLGLQKCGLKQHTGRYEGVEQTNQFRWFYYYHWIIWHYSPYPPSFYSIKTQLPWAITIFLSRW